MEINPDIFRAYDIRGIYPSELNEKTSYLVGRAFVKFFKKTKPNVVIGRDARFSSDFLSKSLIKGINEQGANVIDIGLATTPMLYFAVAHYGFDGGVIVSASHNPSKYNGFKLVAKNAIPVSGESGLRQIKKLAEKAQDLSTLKKGKTIKKNILSDYLKFNLGKFDFKNFRPLRMVIDTANAVPGILVKEIFKHSHFKVFYLFLQLNGSFPNHEPNPLIEKNLRFLKKEILIKKRIDLGVAFDGDGDRIVFLDEAGRAVPSDLVLALISEQILKENPGKKILYDLRCSNIVKETISKCKGKPIISRVGHSFIKEKMRKENILFAGEFSGHFYHKDHYFSESPLFVLFKIMEIISKKEKPFSELIRPFKKYFHSGEMNFRAKDSVKKLKQLKSRYSDGRISKIDGLRIDFKDWWFLARASNTEPVLRLIVEAKTKELMEKKTKEISSLILRP